MGSGGVRRRHSDVALASAAAAMRREAERSLASTKVSSSLITLRCFLLPAALLRERDGTSSSRQEAAEGATLYTNLFGLFVIGIHSCATFMLRTLCDLDLQSKSHFLIRSNRCFIKIVVLV